MEKNKDTSKTRLSKIDKKLMELDNRADKHYQRIKELEKEIAIYNKKVEKRRPIFNLIPKLFKRKSTSTPTQQTIKENLVKEEKVEMVAGSNKNNKNIEKKKRKKKKKKRR